MANRGPNPPLAPGRSLDEGVSLEVLTDSVVRAHSEVTFEDSVISFFLYAKELIVDGLTPHNTTSVLTAHFLLNFCTVRTQHPRTHKVRSNLPQAFLGLVGSAAIASGSNPDVYPAADHLRTWLQRGAERRPSPEPSRLEKAFKTLVDMRRAEVTDEDEACASAMADELEGGLRDLFAMLQSVVRGVTGCPVDTTAADVQRLVAKALACKVGGGFQRAVDSLVLMVGFLAAEMEEAYGSPPADLSTTGSSFCYDLYLYIGFKYSVITSEEYERLCSHPVTSFFTEEIGKAVILLSHGYRSRILGHLESVNGVFRIKHHSPEDYTAWIVKHSLDTHPSSYRYMVLLSLISEIAVNVHYNRFRIPPFRDYMYQAFRCYNESAMREYESLLRSRDNLEKLRSHANRLSEAWDTIGNVATDVRVLRAVNVDEIIARFGENDDYFDLFSSGTDRDDQESLRDVMEELSLDDEGIIDDDNTPDLQEEQVEEMANLGEQGERVEGADLGEQGEQVEGADLGEQGERVKEEGASIEGQEELVEPRSNPDGQENVTKSQGKSKSKSKKKSRRR